MATHSLSMGLVPRQKTEPRLTTTLEHGIKPELVPRELNLVNLVDGVISLNEVPFDDRALLYRDMRYGMPLMTKKEAEKIGRALMTLARKYANDLRTRLSEPTPPPIEEIIAYDSKFQYSPV